MRLQAPDQRVNFERAYAAKTQDAFKGQRCGVRAYCTRSRGLTTYAMEELRRDRRIAPFILKGELTGRHLGNGAYGSVEEASNILNSYLSLEWGASEGARLAPPS